MIVECDSFDRATEIAARLADCPARRPIAPSRTSTSGRSPTADDLEADRDACTGRRRGPAARAGAAGPRRAGAPLRALRRGRGRRAGGAARGRRAVADATGVPDNPRGWLITVAARRLTDLCAASRPGGAARTPWPRSARRGSHRPRTPAAEHDDTLILLFLCCHPALSPASQIALTLRAVGGLTTAEIARAFLVPEATMAQRISRAKQRIKDSGVPFGLPPPTERAERLRRRAARALPDLQRGLRQPAPGPTLQRADLAAEAIRLTRLLHRAAARRRRGRRAARADAAHRRPPAGPHRRRRRAGPAGRAGPDAAGTPAPIAEGVALISAALPRGAGRPVPAAGRDRRACTTRRRRAEETDWPQILAPVRAARCASPPNPMVTLNRAVAVAMVRRARGRAGPARHAGRRRPARRATTGWTRSARTCWRWPATPAGGPCGVTPRRGAPPACRSSGDFLHDPRRPAPNGLPGR